ncbi:MAG TPA: stalk domain-containing protein [Pseudobacteroides sp.]|uniref:stalk domain-containing protein n=1 Tax=Pseudobacteroides sp. TaxID=1968840 RepID=UPI002F923828
MNTGTRRVIAVLSIVFVIFGVSFNYAYSLDAEISELLQKMSILSQEGKFEESISVTDQLFAKDKTHMAAYEFKSMAYFRLGKIDKAYDVLVEQLKLNPRNKIAIYNAACACAKLGKKDNAIEYVKQLLTLEITEKNALLKDKDLDSIKQAEEFKKLTGISVRVDGELLYPDVLPINKDGRIMLPMRSIFEALGANISWDDKSKTVTAVKGNTTVKISINKKIANINGEDIEIDVPPALNQGRTMVPVRFVSESLGQTVSWDPENQHVDIISEAPKGNADGYEEVKSQLNGMTKVSVIDGMWPDPYHLGSEEGMIMVIATDKKALDLMNSLDDAKRKEYMYNIVQDNYGFVVGCDTVFMKFIYEGKVYYSGTMSYDKGIDSVNLTYYEKGLPSNVVKQYKNTLNYKDFYLLPKEEQTSTSLKELS